MKVQNKNINLQHKFQAKKFSGYLNLKMRHCGDWRKCETTTPATADSSSAPSRDSSASSSTTFRPVSRISRRRLSTTDASAGSRRVGAKRRSRLSRAQRRSESPIRPSNRHRPEKVFNLVLKFPQTDSGITLTKLYLQKYLLAWLTLSN